MINATIFTNAEHERIQAWHDADKPVPLHAWLGIAKDVCDARWAATRAAGVERYRKWLESTPVLRTYMARAYVRIHADRFRWEDDGGPALPDDRFAHPDGGT